LQLQTFDHERHQGLPALEAQVAGQGAQIVEEGLGPQERAQAMLAGIEQLQQGVKQEGQKIEGRQQGREMLLAVAEVVGQVVALGLDGVGALVLHLPASETGSS